jgi:hypothetical protein
MAESDDDTVPTGRAGVDPLIAYPLESTGQTGEIERPGDQTPWWFIPGMFAVALGFIGLLIYINDTRDGDGGAAAVPESTASTAPAPTDPPPVSQAPVAVTEPEAVESTTSATAVPTTVDPRLADLPAPGMIQVGTGVFEIAARCEVHLPYDPVDTETQVSSYFFFDEAGERGLVERVFDGETDTATRLIAGTFTSSSQVNEIGDSGAFIASFVGAEVLVNPAMSGEPECGDRVVTNEPARFAEPHTYVILDVCVEEGGPTGTTISGLTSEGSRFEILQAGGELAEIVFERGPDDQLRTSAPATILRTGDQLSASGVISNGIDDLDITIDIGATTDVADARLCSAADRLS